MGPRYRFSIGTGYTEEKLPGKLSQKSRKTSDFARMWSRKIGFERRLVEILGKCFLNPNFNIPEARTWIFGKL